MANINEALSLLLVGMITVFIILGLVVVLGNLVIRLTNRFTPVSLQSQDPVSSHRRVHTKKLAAIVAAVDAITEGKGQITSIDKK